jgi:hypothetical protein
MKLERSFWAAQQKPALLIPDAAFDAAAISQLDYDTSQKERPKHHEL